MKKPLILPQSYLYPFNLSKMHPFYIYIFLSFLRSINKPSIYYIYSFSSKKPCFYRNITSTRIFREIMAPGVVRYSLIFVLSVLFSSDLSLAEKPPMKAMLPKKVVRLQQDPIFSSSSAYTTQLDEIPIVQPTTPTGTPNTYSPTPFPPTTTSPYGDPTTQPPPSGFQPNNPTPFPSGPMTPSVPTGPTNPTGPTGPSSSSGGSWCVASSSASETALQVALDYACGYGGTDCSAIQQGASCYNPNTVRDHASYAFNAYYQKNPAPTSCSFGGVAQLTTTDPSSGSCRFPSSKSTGMMTPPTPPMPSTPTTPTVNSPINPYPTSPSVPLGGGGGGGFTDQPGYTSSEPTGEPSSADFIASSLLLTLMITSLLVFLNREI